MSGGRRPPRHRGHAPANRRAQVAAGSHAEQAIAEMVALYRTHHWTGSRWAFAPPGGPVPGGMLVRQPPPVGGVPGQLTYRAKAVTDYFGFLADRGRMLPVAFDVKSVGGESSFALKPGASHQLQFCQEVRRYGGMGFFLCVDLSAGWAWLISTSAELAALAAGDRVPLCKRRGGVPVEHATLAIPRRQVPGTALFGFDFLRALLDNPDESGQVGGSP